jgi:hypothetical protein
MAHILYFDGKNVVGYPRLAESHFFPVFARRKSLMGLCLTRKTLYRFLAHSKVGVPYTQGSYLGPIDVQKFL